VLLAALLLGACATPAQAAGVAQKTVRATQGTVVATLSYQQGSDSFGNATFANLRLQISRVGAAVYERPVSSRYCESSCDPEAFGASPLAVKDLEGNGQSEVVLDLNTGGAHCCTVVQVFSYDAHVSSYRLLERNFGDPGALLTDVAGDGHLEFESADDRFAYAFTSFAYSALPPQIWRLRKGRFVDVTRAFAKVVAADAKHQFKSFLANRAQGLGLGYIAAWAADECLLGRHALASATLAREARLHRLRSGDGLSPGGGAFVKKLERFLRKNGYT
jgi:hypothetical protein